MDGNAADLSSQAATVLGEIVVGEIVVVGLKHAAQRLLGGVIEWAGNRRAEQFFQGFIKGLGAERDGGPQDARVDAALQGIAREGWRKEAFFEAFRHVCLSKSRTIGPRIVGLLTGLIMLEGRVATAVEELVFDAAEGLSDADLLDFKDVFDDYVRHAATEQGSGRWVRDRLEVDFGLELETDGTPIDVSPLNFPDTFGLWGVRAARVGLLSNRVMQQTEWSTAWPAGESQAGFRKGVIFEAPCALLSSLMDRVMDDDMKEELRKRAEEEDREDAELHQAAIRQDEATRATWS